MCLFGFYSLYSFVNHYPAGEDMAESIFGTKQSCSHEGEVYHPVLEWVKVERYGSICYLDMISNDHVESLLLYGSDCEYSAFCLLVP
jgi:hypothetical protein